MPIIPNASVSVNTDPIPTTAVTFNKTLTTADTAQDLALVPVSKFGRKYSIVNDGPGNAYIAFDATATLNDMEIAPKDAVSDDGLQFATKISFIGESGKKPHVRGILWAGT